MRWLLVLALVVTACTPAPPAAPGDTTAPLPSGTPAPPTQLPAVESARPSLAAFRSRAHRACSRAAAAIAAAPLAGDPLRKGARPRHVRAAVAHYRAASAAWTEAAGDLWDFGLPEARVAQSLITALDTVAQYSHQTADLLAADDRDAAQAGVGAVDTAIRDANGVARRLGIGRIDQCGTAPVRLRGAARVAVTATDFSFTAASGNAGATRFVLRNAGDEPHHLFVVRLRQPGTLDDAVRADRLRGRPGAFLRDDGRASPVAAPGESTTLDVRLRAGVYGLLCMVASEDGTPHAYKGMATEVVIPR